MVAVYNDNKYTDYQNKLSILDEILQFTLLSAAVNTNNISPFYHT